MIALLTLLEIAISELTSGILFADSTGGADRELRFFVGTIPPKRNDESMGEDAPFCFLSVPDFTFDKESRIQTVVADFTLYAPDDHNQGISDLDLLINSLLLLPRKRLQPYKFNSEIQCQILEEKHPFYKLRLQMDYIGLNSYAC